eukprot:COSAG02_NODE_636_length_19238_cov_10.598046_9_plen_566_part_00
MPCTRSQSTDEPSSDGPLLLRVCAGDRVSPRSQQLAATQAAAEAAYDADKQYDEDTLAAVVVVYDTGRKGTAQLPPIRGLTRDKETGEWRMLTKEGKTLVDFRSHIVGVHSRGWDAPMWGLSNEQAAEFDRFEWLLQPDAYERVLRGCATMCAGGLATLRTQQAHVLAITHLLEMLYTPEALALKERLIAYWRFLEQYRIANRPYIVDDATSEEVVSSKRAAEDAPQDSAKRSRSSTPETDVLTEILGEDTDEDQTDEQCTSPVSSDSTDSSTVTVEDGDVAAVQHAPELTDVEAQRYVSAVLAHINEARDVSLPAVLEMLKEAREDAEERLGDVAADDEALRVATRAMLVKDHSFRTLFAQLNDGIRAAMDHGCQIGQTKGFECLRNDIGHTTFDTGAYRIVFDDDGGCEWRLARTNKKGTQGYTQDLRAACPDLADFLYAYRPVAYAMRPPGHEEAPVLCYTAGQKQNEIGRMLSVAKTSRANKAGYCDDAVSERRKGFRRQYNKNHPDAPLSEKCKPRHVLRRFRDGTPAERAAADRARDSSNRNYGTGSTESGAAGAAAAR